MGKLKEATLRDFGGGWNASDSDKSLSSKFQVVSDNIVRGTDGHIRVRHGTKLFADLKQGIETAFAATAHDLTITSGKGEVKILWTAHPFVSGDHITLSGFTGGAIGGIPEAAFKGTFGVHVVDANNILIYIRISATTTVTASRTFVAVRDTHMLAGKSIFARYYKDYLMVFTNTGEIIAVNNMGVGQIIWNLKAAKLLTQSPWGPCKRVSAEVIRGRLIAVNGALNDKPLAIDTLNVQYLVDAATSSNGAVPRAEFVAAASQYMMLINTEYGQTMVEVGAKNTVFTGSREGNPSDAVEINLGMLTQTIESNILGASVVRSRVFIGLADRSMLGTLGIYNGAFHVPDFNDNIAEFGTFSHHSIVSLGNDIFCAGMNGINSLEVSRLSGEFVPSTLSDLIHPVMLRHFARLNDDDRRFNTFAVYDNTSRTYMLFVPKYSDITATMRADPCIVTTTLQKHNLMFLRYFGHTLDAGDWVDISGATDYNAALTGSMINGRRRIRHVVDKSTLVIETDPYPASLNVTFGGTNVTVKPVSDETVCYAYEYNTRLKIRRWTRFKGLKFQWGTRSQLNNLFFGQDQYIWQMGNDNLPLSADFVGMYDQRVYTASTTYTKGRRVRDTTDGLVYRCVNTYTSSAETNFAAARELDPLNWEEYEGEPISWRMESAWSDFDARKYNKEIETVNFDTSGDALFRFSLFTDSIYIDPASFLRIPQATLEFTGEDTPGFGGGSQPFGGGRNTAQEWLHGMPVSGKLFKFGLSGESTHPLQINAVTMYYHTSQVMT